MKPLIVVLVLIFVALFVGCIGGAPATPDSGLGTSQSALTEDGGKPPEYDGSGYKSGGVPPDYGPGGTPKSMQDAMDSMMSTIAKDSVDQIMGDPDSDLCDMIDAFDLTAQNSLGELYASAIMGEINSLIEHPDCRRRLEMCGDKATEMGYSSIAMLIYSRAIEAPENCGGGSITVDYTSGQAGYMLTERVTFHVTGTLYEPDPRRYPGEYVIEEGTMDWEYYRAEDDDWEGVSCATRTTSTGSGTIDMSAYAQYSTSINMLSGAHYGYTDAVGGNTLSIFNENNNYAGDGNNYVISVAADGRYYQDGEGKFVAFTGDEAPEGKWACDYVKCPVKVHTERIGPATWPYKGEEAPCNALPADSTAAPPSMGIYGLGYIAPGSTGSSGSYSDDYATYSWSFTLPEER